MFYNAFYEVINFNIVNQENLKQSGCALYIAKKNYKKTTLFFLKKRFVASCTITSILRQIPRQKPLRCPFIWVSAFHSVRLASFLSNCLSDLHRRTKVHLFCFILINSWNLHVCDILKNERK